MAHVNGQVYDGGTIDVSVTGLHGSLTGIESISFGHSLDTQKVKGSGDVYRGTTPGIISAKDGSMEIWVSELNNWINACGGTYGFHRQTFDVTVTYRMVGMPLNVVVLQGCRAIDVSSAHTFGASDNLTCTVEFSVIDVVYNGVGIAGKVISEVVGALRSAGISPF